LYVRTYVPYVVCTTVHHDADVTKNFRILLLICFYLFLKLKYHGQNSALPLDLSYYYCMSVDKLNNPQLTKMKSLLSDLTENDNDEITARIFEKYFTVNNLNSKNAISTTVHL
jgi:hypothetical protein